MKYLREIFLVIPIIIIIVFMVTPMKEKFRIDQEKYICYETSCLKETLDEFDECIDLGRESTGFMSSEHYYLCDGFKITNKCLEYGDIEVDTEWIKLGLRCVDREESSEKVDNTNQEDRE